jgi:hypothetical protein
MRIVDTRGATTPRTLIRGVDDSGKRLQYALACNSTIPGRVLASFFQLQIRLENSPSFIYQIFSVKRTTAVHYGEVV